MLLIKRYPNRKLYDTQAKQYITLEGIARLIRQGLDVQVIDHASGNDLTAVILTQVIAEREKRHTGTLPHTLLADLILASRERLLDIQRNLAAPMGGLQQSAEDLIESILISKNIPSREDIDRIVAQLDSLNEELDKLAKPQQTA
jgi:polyhydroxyalkanoate synthesis repressor PhaR